MGYIYKITNNVNGKMYIGQTRRTVGKRWIDHKHRRMVDDSCSKLYKAMRKYGKGSFSVEEVEQCPDEMLNEKEIYWIDKLGTVENGYNISKGGMGYIHESEPIAQYDLDGNYICTYESATEVAKAMNTRPQSIYSICDKWFGSWHGYQFRYASDCEDVGKVKPGAKPTPVHQYTMDGEYIRSYDSISSAMEQFGTRGTGGIRSVCTGRCRHSHGYRWSYEKVDRLPPMRDTRHGVPVDMLDLDGNYIRTYKSVKSASEDVGVSRSVISVALGKAGRSAGGYRWDYTDKAF